MMYYLPKWNRMTLFSLIFKTLTFRTDYSYNNFSNEAGTINSYEFLNASLSYRKNKDAKFEYEIKATNLFDTELQNKWTGLQG